MSSEVPSILNKIKTYQHPRKEGLKEMTPTLNIRSKLPNHTQIPPQTNPDLVYPLGDLQIAQ
jgi:hypothetical protein